MPDDPGPRPDSPGPLKRIGLAMAYALPAALIGGCNYWNGHQRPVALRHMALKLPTSRAFRRLSGVTLRPVVGPSRW